MVATATEQSPVWRRRTRAQEFTRLALWIAGLMVFAIAWQQIAERTNWQFVWDAGPAARDIGSRMLPPDWSYMDRLWRPIWDTINIATLGTLLAIVFAAPIAFLAARNTTPSAKLVRPVALFVIVSSRSINSLIWALLLVTIVGPGLLAGVIAIALRSIGFCAKLLYEAIEEIDACSVEAVSATGATGVQVLDYGIIPQILPAFAGISVFRWDINIRESTILGFVGAGGIGLELSASVNTPAWSQVSLILLIIVGLVIVGEWVSAKIRAKII